MTTDSIEVNPVSSVNSIAARREARRRKILENAESRLKKLTGVEQKSHVLIDDFRPVQYEETSTENHFDHSTIENEIILPSIESTNLISSLQTSQVDKSVNRLGTWKCNDLTTILIISFLANVFTMFSFFCGESELNVGCNMIFLPFIGAKCLEYLLQENREPENNILQLFLMANLRSNHLKRMFMYTQYLTSFTQDLCVYFFFFVCINQLFRIFAIL